MWFEFDKISKPSSGVGLQGKDSTDYDKSFRSYELTSAQVIQLVRTPADILIGGLKVEGGMNSPIGAVICRPLQGGSSKEVSAWPLNPNIKQYPAEGEIVRIGRVGGDGPMFYELLNQNNNVNYNESGLIISTSEPDITNSATGDEAVEKKLTSSAFFNKRSSVPLLAPLSSDLIIESRFGSAIRMTDITARKELSSYSPSIFISNNISFREPSLTEENINEDGSNILMLSGDADPGLVPRSYTQFFRGTKEGGFKTAYERSTSYRKNVRFVNGTNNSINPSNQEKPTFKSFTYPSALTGDQVFISSDRVVLNSKSAETLIFSRGQIGMFTSQKVSIDSARGVDISTPRSSFRVNSNEMYLNSMNLYLAGEGQRSEPAILGNKLMTFLEVILGAFYHYVSTDADFKATFLGQPGASRSARNFKKFLESYVLDGPGGAHINQSRLEEILSDKVFIGGNTLNPTFDY